MVEVVYEVVKVMDLYLLSEFLEKIRSNLAGVADTFIQEVQSSSKGIFVPYAQQIIALRRLNWLYPFFQKKIQFFKNRAKNAVRHAAISFEIPMLEQCKSNANALQWKSWPILMDLLEEYPNLVDARGVNIRSRFREEVTEDICYSVSSSLFCPCNEAVWCDVASTLIHDLCFAIARDRWDYSMPKSSSILSRAILQKTMKAAEIIRNPKTVEVLEFDADVWKRYALNNRADISKEPRKTKCFLKLASDCKGPEKRLPAPHILRGKLPPNQTNILKTIHKPWYLTRQILFVADTFAQEYLSGDKTYSFDNLRQKLGLATEHWSMFSKGIIELDLDSSLFFGSDFESTYSKENKLKLSKEMKERSNRNKTANRVDEKKKEKKQKRKPSISAVRKLLFWDVLVKRLKELGWTIDWGNRPSDFYLLPPGVQRGKNFKPRVDFFDSAPLVIKCLTNDQRYCNLPEIKSIMKEYRMCQEELEQMISSKNKEYKALSSEKIVEYLRHKVNPLQNGSTNPVTTIKATFLSDKLGLLLSMEDDQIRVKGVQNKDFQKQVCSGDAMIAVGDSSVRKKSLEDACELIRVAGRPVTITFERKLPLLQSSA